MRYDNFSHTPNRFEFSKIVEMFNDPKSLAKYFYEHPDFVATAQDGAFGWAEDQGKLYGFEKGYLPNFLKDLQTGFEILKGQNIWPSDPNQEYTLYRGVVIFDVKPDTTNPGICWSYERSGAKDWLDALVDEDDYESAPCIMEGKTKASNIDWLMTLLLLCTCPEEKEIRLWDDSKENLTITDWKVL